MSKKRLTLALYLAATLGGTVTGATYEVATRHSNADDRGPGTAEAPWKTVAKAAATVKPGDTVLIRGGTYRERVVLKTDGSAEAPIRFEAAPGEHVVLTGADRLTGWEKAENDRPIFRVAWPHKFITWNPSMTHPNDEYHQVIGRCEQVVVNGYLLRQMLQADQLAPGTFFADTTNRVLLVWDSGSRDLNKCHVEASVRQEIVRVEGDHVHLRGLRFRFAANMAQRGAVVLSGAFNHMEDCVIECMNSSGATFSGPDALVRSCVFRDNGQLGFGAGRAHRLLLTECIVENNNIKGYDRGWEAGGNKLAFCRDAVLERSRFVRNHGNGIWFDIGNTNCVVRHCLIADNDDAGIFYEISFALHAHDNVIVGNGFADTAGAWGAQAGISLSSSPGCVIERNLILGNREGFNFREQIRSTPTIEDRNANVPVWNHDQTIRNNMIVLNRDAQVWGWFDINDNRHWPAKTRQAARPDRDDALGDSAGKRRSLEDLNLSFENNVYWAAQGQGWFKWGTTWRKHESYPDLARFQAELGIDSGGKVGDPGFADIHRLDFRISEESMSRLKECYPQGHVPGVQLGVVGR